jgi:four helix bundle protein
MRPIQELDVYKLSETLSDIIWKMYDSWDFKAQRTIGLQVIRSSDSIAANLSEGFGRFSMADRKKFYLYSRGSFEETKCWLRKAMRRKIMTEADEKMLTIIINELGPKLNAFIAKTGKLD